MKKVLFFACALAAMAIATTSCKKGGSNEPEQEQTGQFSITIENITYQAADVTVSCADTNVYFYFDIMETSEFAKTSADSIVADYVAYFDEMIEAYKDYYDLTYTDFLSKGKDSYSFDDLDEETDYTVFAFQFDLKTKSLVGTMGYKNFKTLKHELTSDLSFDFSKVGGTLTITPSNNNEDYVFGFLTAEDLADGYDVMDYVDSYAMWGMDEDLHAKGELVIDLNDYIYAGTYTVQAAAVKITTESEEYEGETYTYNNYERTGKIYSLDFGYTVEDGAEEEPEDEYSFAPGRKMATKSATLRKPLALKRGAK